VHMRDSGHMLERIPGLPGLMLFSAKGQVGS
jgi:hypothetical protein